MNRSVRIEIEIQEATALPGQVFATRRFSATLAGASPIEIAKLSTDISVRLDGLADGVHQLEVADLSTAGDVMGQPAVGTITIGANTAPMTYMATKSLSAVVL